MKKVKEVNTELTDEQKNLLSKVDFSDTFSTTNQVDNIERITKLIFNTTPKWIKLLFKLRNSLAALVGLKTVKPDDYREGFIVDDYVNFFRIYAICDNEIVIGADDSHLNFRAIIHNTRSESYNIHVITLVEYNNLKGRIYMGIIKPFHRLVVKRMVKNAYRAIH